jgi:hypothetical protein
VFRFEGYKFKTEILLYNKFIFLTAKTGVRELAFSYLQRPSFVYGRVEKNDVSSELDRSNREKKINAVVSFFLSPSSNRY